MKDKTFTVYDTTIGIWREHYAPGGEDWETHEAVRMLLVRYGFSFHQDPHTKKHYRCIARFHHSGNKHDVHFISRLTGRHHELVFFEDVVRDNQNGGQYHFDKLAKMPYQRRKKTELAMRKVIDLLVSLGFTEESGRYPDLALERVIQHRKELKAFQGQDFYRRERKQGSYNFTDADHVLMRDGDLRYFYDYDGRLKRGRVYRNINNMWWVVCSRYTLTNIANFRLFQWRTGLALKNPDLREKRLVRLEDEAIKIENFEQAARFRDLLKAA